MKASTAIRNTYCLAGAWLAYKAGGAIAIAVVLLAGCASFNDAMTPGTQVLADPFAGDRIVRQAPVSASSSLGEAWQTLGFEWRSSAPQLVFVTAGRAGVVPIEALTFKADGQVLARIAPAAAWAEYADGWSSCRFQMPLVDFLAIARGRTVLMRISSANDYTVSTFGSDHPGAIVNAKFKPFTDQILQQAASQ